MSKRDRPNFVAELVALETRKNPDFEQLLVEAEAFRKSQETKLRADAMTKSEVEPVEPKKLEPRGPSPSYFDLRSKSLTPEAIEILLGEGEGATENETGPRPRPLCTGYEVVCPDGRVRDYPYHNLGDAESTARLATERQCRLYPEPSPLELSCPPCPEGLHVVRPVVFQTLSHFIEVLSGRSNRIP